MAEAILREHVGGLMDIHSAGLDPEEVHPMTKVVLQEMGIDVSQLRSKSVQQFLGKVSITHAIFVCEQAETHCPTTYPFALNRLTWPFDDPAAEPTNDPDLQLLRFRRVRDEIEQRIVAWLAAEGIEGYSEVNG
jgi:arsenate reductase